MKTLVRAVAGLFVLALLLGTATAATGRLGSGSATAAIAGTVQTIDIAKKAVTVATSVGTSVRLMVGGSASVTRNGAPSSLAGLALNDSVTGQYKVSRLSAIALAATGPAVTSLKGKATNVSFASGALSVGATALQTTATTRISRNGQIVALRQITLRDSLVAHAATGTNVALDVVASGPKEVEVHGTISAIVGNSVTVGPDDGSPAVTVSVGPATIIEVNDQAGVMGDLQVALAVEVEYDPTTLVAFSISADTEQEDEEVEGAVSAVDTLGGTVTITPKNGGADVTLTVIAATEIKVNDAGATISDIQIGMPVKAEYAAGTLQAKEIDAGGEDD